MVVCDQETFHFGIYVPDSSSAIVLCCSDTRDYLINYARSLIYTTALGFPFLASIRTAYELLSEGITQPVSFLMYILTLREFGLTSTASTQTSTIDFILADQIRRPWFLGPSCLRSRSLPEISHLFSAQPLTSSAGGSMSTGRVYCACNHGTYRSCRKGEGTGLSPYG